VGSKGRRNLLGGNERLKGWEEELRIVNSNDSS
jgi:hypothetical protein